MTSYFLFADGASLCGLLASTDVMAAIGVCDGLRKLELVDAGVAGEERRRGRRSCGGSMVWGAGFEEIATAEIVAAAGGCERGCELCSGVSKLAAASGRTGPYTDGSGAAGADADACAGVVLFVALFPSPIRLFAG